MLSDSKENDHIGERQYSSHPVGMLTVRMSLYPIVLSVLIAALPCSLFGQPKQAEREGAARIEDSEYDIDELQAK